MNENSNNEPNTNLKKQQQNILTLYIGFFISAIFNFIPIASAQVFGAVFFLVLFIATYIYRAQSIEDSLQHSHTHYLIKTIWVFSLFLFIGIILASLLADNSALQDTMDKASNGILMSEAELESLMSGYIQNNFVIFIVTLCPSFVYLFYRLGKGLRLVRHNINIPHLKNWF